MSFFQNLLNDLWNFSLMEKRTQSIFDRKSKRRKAKLIDEEVTREIRKQKRH
jgi:hypothetical protein